MNRPGQTPRFGGYPQNPPLQNRTNALGSGRLQNTAKLSNTNGASWGFGAPNGVSGLENTRPRPPGTGPTSFAQSIGGSHSAAPPDLSEFPSLSGNSQSQYQNQPNATGNSAIWQRQTQQTPVQRPPQLPQSTTTQQNPASNPQHPASPSNDDMFIGSSHLQGSLEDYRQTNHSQGQVPGPRLPPTQGVDDFPPLGRNGTDGSEADQRGAFSTFAGHGPFATTQDETQPSQGLPTGFGNGPESTRSSSIAERTITPGNFGTITNGRSPTEQARPGQTPTNHITTLLSGFTTSRTANANLQQQSLLDFDNRTPDAGSQQKPEDMSDSELYGLSGFLAKIRSDDPLVSGLARGQDLTQLGLNLNSPEALWPSFNGPFAEPNGRPLQPDFTLPECYTVTNVHRVREKLPSFTDETLFWIFYTQPRDLLQELAASELTNRNWRYHKQHQMWLTKDPSLPEPRRLNDEMERGSYLFWNHRNWEKIRQTDFHLEYASLAPTNGRANGVA